MPTIFSTPLNDVYTSVASYTPGSGQLSVAGGTGSLFGNPSPSAPIRITVITQASYGSTAEVRTIFKATGRSGDTLSGLTVIEGTSDRTFAAGDIVEMRFTAGAVSDLNAAVNALEAGGGGGGGGGGGTVLSVGLAVPTGLSITGTNPVTTSGTITITTALAGIIKGTGSGFVAATGGTDYYVPGAGIALSDVPNLPASRITSGQLPIAQGGTGNATASTAFAALSPLTTKGDLLIYNTSPARLPVGADGYVLTADSSQPTGLKWALPSGGYSIVTATDGATVTFDLSAGNYQQVTLGGNRTLAISNVGNGQPFTLELQQDGTGSRTVTWFSGIRWANGDIPNLTTTPNKADVFTFRYKGGGVYLGWPVGLNH